MKKLFKLALCLCLIVTLCACATKEDKESETNSKEVKIELEANQTTGYEWVYTTATEGIVNQVSKEYVQDKTDGETTGAGGKQVFVFSGLKEGEATLNFEYVRSWETEVEPADTKTYTLVVDKDLNISIK